jgi:hypothetical protein
MNGNDSISLHTRYVLFALGAALGSSLGLVIGSLLTAWLGSGIARIFQRLFRRTRKNDHPSFDLLLQ